MKTENQSTIAMVCITILCIAYLVSSNNSKEKELQKAKVTIDSLKAEIEIKDKFIDDSYHIEIDYNNKVNWLYDNYPAIHKKMFEDASN